MNNQGYYVAGPHNKDFNALGSIPKTRALNHMLTHLGPSSCSYFPVLASPFMLGGYMLGTLSPKKGSGQD